MENFRPLTSKNPQIFVKKHGVTFSLGFGSDQIDSFSIPTWVQKLPLFVIKLEIDLFMFATRRMPTTRSTQMDRHEYMKNIYTLQGPLKFPFGCYMHYGKKTENENPSLKSFSGGYNKQFNAKLHSLVDANLFITASQV